MDGAYFDEERHDNNDSYGSEYGRPPIFLKELPNSSVEFGIEYHFLESRERPIGVDATAALEHVAKTDEIVTRRTG